MSYIVGSSFGGPKSLTVVEKALFLLLMLLLLQIGLFCSLNPSFQSMVTPKSFAVSGIFMITALISMENLWFFWPKENQLELFRVCNHLIKFIPVHCFSHIIFNTYGYFI